MYLHAVAPAAAGLVVGSITADVESCQHAPTAPDLVLHSCRISASLRCRVTLYSWSSHEPAGLAAISMLARMWGGVQKVSLGVMPSICHCCIVLLQAASSATLLCPSGTR